jgi:hypothetical protein
MRHLIALCVLAAQACAQPAAFDLGEVIATADAAQDRDRDGLRDALEAKVAEAFVPHLVFDSAEAHRLPGEPKTLFQVRPVGEGRELDVRYAFLFRRDGGYGPSSWCDDAHNGDNQAAGLRVRSTDGRRWTIAVVTNGAYAWPAHKRVEWYRDTHARIYMSSHKHHQFFDTSMDGEDSPYSKWGCNDDVNGRGARILPSLVSPLPDRRPSNVGEPEAHDAAHFIGALDAFGYAGEHAWGTRNFTGGLPDQGSTSPMASKWSSVAFKKPGEAKAPGTLLGLPAQR